MNFDIRDYNLFLDIDWYPFYFPGPDKDGNVGKGCVLRPLKYFEDRGLNPREFYTFLVNKHKIV